MWPFKAVRLLSVLGLTLALLGPVPQVDLKPIKPASHSATPSLLEPPQPPVELPEPIGPQAPPPVHTIHLKSGDVIPGAPDTAALQQLARSDGGRLHVLLQLDFIPRDLAKAEYEKSGVKLLAYVPDYAWIASVPASDPAAALNLPGVTWAGPLSVNDKLDPAILNNTWGSWSLAPDGTAAVSVITHLDEDVATTRALVEKYGGKITGDVIGIRMLLVEMPQQNIAALAAEEPVQWIEQAEPPLGPTNDGIRQQIGVDTLQAAPYNLNGTNIDILVYDSGQVGDHTDFGTRLTHGDADTVSEHSTHVAGTVGGSGANSVAQGGTTALQWRGMAPNADLISYGTEYSGSGPIFYQNVPDIEHDFATAQNTYGADLGTASVGSNVYQNYPLSCTLLMGKYGAASVLIDQIVRGGNSQVGLGDKYISTWAVGNERNSPNSCSDTYSSIAPPAAAKNPIHVGASNTNNNTMTSFSSWGPTGDGRIKPIVVAGGCQSSGDFGIKSTDNSPVDDYTVMCGTSMATPAVGGSIALMLQHYRAVYNTSGNFWPSTAKAILMQTADDFGNPGPDYQWGFGQVDIQAAVDLISRRAFRQDNVAAGSTDVFYMIVPTSTTPLQVSLAWDDYEATFNANPTLINNLDLELEAPSGTIWRPWILNAASPANNATRGVNTVDNQEQATVSSPEIGTWIVRVKGTTVPHGPQDYSLACEGCKPLDVGVCQSKVSTAALSLPTVLESENSTLSRPIQVAAPETITAGEQWQRSLEQPIGDPQPDDQAQLLEQARGQGDEAVVALSETLTGEARDRAMDDIVAAQQRLRDAAPPPPETRPISEAEEQARLAADQITASTNRAQALARTADPTKDQAQLPDIEHPTFSLNAPAVDRTVGNGCTYPTIAAAISAASPGDRLLIEGGRTFTENLSIGISLTLQGGYNGCASGSSARTTINGGAAGRVMYIYENLNIRLENLNIVNGNTGGNGAGLFVRWNTQLSGTNLEIYNNTSSALGGGVRLWGGSATFTNTNIYDNIALEGAGVYGEFYNGYASALNLSSYADVYSNDALSGNGFGGGVYLRESTVSLADCSDIYNNNAINGGGAYLITSTLTINGSCSEIENNTANAQGGGVYAQGSNIYLQDQVELYNNTAGATTTANGGGAYLDDSNLYSYRSAIYYNTASFDGGGVYAVNGSIVDMELGGYPCAGPRCSQLSYNEADSSAGYGGAIRADDSSVYLYSTFVENNTALLGGGLYLYNNATSYVYNSLFTRNNAAGGTGDGVRLNTASLSGTNNTFAYNEAGGAATGRAIDLSGSAATLSCSVVWGHASSINVAGQNVTYSDIQGGYGNSTNLNVNPLFVASGSQDYHLQNTSPVIDRCVSGLAIDFEGEPRPMARTTTASPYDMGADEVSGIDRVGVSGACSYGTIQQAVNAADDGDTIRVAAGVYFENVNITAGKVITIEGGYNNTCASTGAGTTRIDGSASGGSTIDILGGTTRLRNVQVAWGSDTGGGLDVDGNGQVTLDSTEVLNNHGDYGGGVWLNTGSVVTLTNGSTVHDNTAMSPGGGVRTWGKFYGYGNSSEVSWNCAPDGGGASVPSGLFYLDDAHMMGNEAVGATGKGGAVYLDSGGVVTLTNHVYLGDAGSNGNTAYDGGAIYADHSTVNLDGSTTTLSNNTATNYGGGVYLINGSTLNMTGGGRIGSNWSSSTGNDALLGAGVYAITSTVNLAGRLFNNIASSAGAGLYATASTVNLTGATVGSPNTNEANQLGASGHEGVGLFLTNNTQAVLNNTTVSSNTFQSTSYTYGGGALVDAGSVLTLTNSRVERHLAPDTSDGRGAGLYVRDATVTLDNSQIISNTAGAVGGGVRVYGGTLNVTNGSALVNNQALTSQGGAIAATSNVGVPHINIANATLQSNTASGNGGAIYFDDGVLDMQATILHRNQAVRGGGIFQTGAGTSSLIENSLIYSNTSTTDLGAGIRNEGGVVTLTHVTLANNVGGAGYSQSGVGLVNNSIAWGNTDGGFWNTSGVLTGTCNIDQSSTVGANVNPSFVSPGAGEDYHLKFGSPAIDACVTGQPNDLDHVSRPVGSGFDMGAYEYAIAPTLVPDRSGSGLPLSAVVYTHTLTNLGAADTYTLTAQSSNGWSITLQPLTPVALNSSQAKIITATVNVPAGVLSGTVDTAVVTATSWADPEYSVAVTDTTLIDRNIGVALTPDRAGVAAPGSVIVYQHTLTNTGNSADVFDVTHASSQGWAVQVDTPLSLNAGQAATISITVTVPTTVISGTIETTVITATSRANTGQFASVTDTTTAIITTRNLYLPIILRN